MPYRIHVTHSIFLIYLHFRVLLKKGNMLTKKQLQEQIELLPDEFSLDELVERLILVGKIKVGENQSMASEIVSDENLVKEIEKWFK
jgi:hypothetical protein